MCPVQLNRMCVCLCFKFRKRRPNNSWYLTDLALLWLTAQKATSEVDYTHTHTHGNSPYPVLVGSRFRPAHKQTGEWTAITCSGTMSQKACGFLGKNATVFCVSALDEETGECPLFKHPSFGKLNLKLLPGYWTANRTNTDWLASQNWARISGQEIVLSVMSIYTQSTHILWWHLLCMLS